MRPPISPATRELLDRARVTGRWERIVAAAAARAERTGSKPDPAKPGASYRR